MKWLLAAVVIMVNGENRYIAMYSHPGTFVIFSPDCLYQHI